MTGLMIVFEGKIILKYFPILIPDPKQHTSVHKASFLFGVCISKRPQEVVSHAVYSTKFFVTVVAFLGQSPYRGESTSEKGTAYFRENDHPCKIKLSYSLAQRPVLRKERLVGNAEDSFQYCQCTSSYRSLLVYHFSNKGD